MLCLTINGDQRPQLYYWSSFFLLSFLWLDIKVLQADMLELPFGDECFDVVIEKGTMVNLHVQIINPLTFSVVLTWYSNSINMISLQLSPSFNSQVHTCYFDIEGCIVRGQWWSMESKAWNYVQGYDHAERCSQGIEIRWHIYLNNFRPGFEFELFHSYVFFSQFFCDSELI